MKAALLPAFLLLGLASAQVVKATRLDIDAAGAKIEFTNLSAIGGGMVAIHGWDKVNGKYRLYSEIPTASNAWKQIGMKFTPLADGELSLILLGKWEQAADKKTLVPLPVFYDLVEVQGAVVKNGDLEELDEKGLPKYWNAPTPSGDADAFRVVKDKSRVKSGAVSVYCWQNQRLSQTIKVKANTPVTITAWVFPGR